jgi:hypothetical protein
MKRVLLVIGLLLYGCATTQTPEGTFEAYMQAYAEGNADRVHELSSESARNDAKRLRKELLTALESDDVAEKILVEGRFAINAKDLRAMNDKELFVWGIMSIRRRLTPAYVRRTVSEMSLVRVRAVVGGAEVIFRNPKGVETIMRLSRTANGWLVDDSPFPKTPQ